MVDLTEEAEELLNILLSDTSQTVSKVLQSTELQVKQATKADEVNAVIKQAVEGISQLKQLSTRDQQILVQHVQQQASKAHGTKAEATTASTYQAQVVSSSIREDDTYYSHDLLVLDEVTYRIVGKIDRLEVQENGEEILIEIKNRMRRLFYEVREYEVSQYTL